MEYLKLRNVASYCNEDVTINLSKQINLFYGQNGSGKSTIANYFYDTNANNENSQYLLCSKSFYKNYKFLVYNEKFIQDIFYEDTQAGIFTLSKENKEIEVLIGNKENDKNKLQLESLNILNKIKENDSRKKDNYEKLKNNIYGKFSKLRKSELRSLLKNNFHSENFCEKILSLDVSDVSKNINLKELEDEYVELIKNKGHYIENIPELRKYIFNSKDISLLEEPILPIKENYRIEIIKKFNSYDWVRHGLKNYMDNDICPFCQSNTIDENFKLEMHNIFNDSYDNLITEIKYLKENYQNYYNEVNSFFNKLSDHPKLFEDDFDKNIIDLIKREISDNLLKLDEKINYPTKSIKLNSMSEIDKFINLIVKKNNALNALNEKVKNFVDSERKIVSHMWKKIRELSEDFISIYKVDEEKLDKEIKKLKKEEINIDSQLKIITQEITELKSNFSNIETTIENINKNLLLLGIKSFKIIKSVSNDCYTLERHGEKQSGSSVFSSLSEGEKTIISFLYFIELCKGRTTKNDLENQSSCVVIDDPISSLSQNYIYDIASFIHYKIINNEMISKVIILTHNLFFFHELIKLGPGEKKFTKKYNLYRVYKNSNSKVEGMEKEQIKNEYQSFWQIIKDASENKAPTAILPNVMRNILEYYFSFVYKIDDLNKQLCNLLSETEDQNYRAFYRFINRSSHSDSFNVHMLGEMTANHYLDLFKKIFEKTGDLRHYNKMRGIE
ncbi:AAA family ATPase [Arsenophonus nasoniae]|uniref:AAA family ATPase n=1 Tax=Arsenophonus nasoniae TaxID=638 RepID=UPI00387A793B